MSTVYSIGDNMASAKSRPEKDDKKGESGINSTGEGFAIERTRPLHDQVLEEILAGRQLA